MSVCLLVSALSRLMGFLTLLPSLHSVEKNYIDIYTYNVVQNFLRNFNFFTLIVYHKNSSANKLRNNQYIIVKCEIKQTNISFGLLWQWLCLEDKA